MVTDQEYTVHLLVIYKYEHPSTLKKILQIFGNPTMKYFLNVIGQKAKFYTRHIDPEVQITINQPNFYFFA